MAAIDPKGVITPEAIKLALETLYKGKVADKMVLTTLKDYGGSICVMTSFEGEHVANHGCSVLEEGQHLEITGLFIIKRIGKE